MATSLARSIEVAQEVRARKIRAFLLTQLSASKSRKDDAFQAYLAEPVRLGDNFFEVGSLIDGKVSQIARPRMLRRAGSLHLRIKHITPPGGISVAVVGTLGGLKLAVAKNTRSTKRAAFTDSSLALRPRWSTWALPTQLVR